MTRGTGLALAIAAAVLKLTLASPCLAADPFQCPRPGTVLSWSSGGRVTIGEQDGFTCLAKDANGGPLRAFLGLFGIPELVSNHGEKLYPFSVGNQIEFDRNANVTATVGSTVTTSTRPVVHDVIRVVRLERVNTKAGTFSAFVIERRETVLMPKGFAPSVYTYWWAPQLGWVVKEVDEFNGHVNRQVEISEWKQPCPPPRQCATSSTP
jgi:hypothetical protein